MNRRDLLLTSAAALLIPTVAAAERLFVVDTNDGYLNLREGPGTQYRIIQRLYGGMGVDAVGASGSWRRVYLPDGTVGWASGNFMATRNRAEYSRYGLTVAPTNDGYLNLRAGPGTQYRIMQRLYAGQGLLEMSAQGGWRQVQLADGARGWVSASYIRYVQ